MSGFSKNSHPLQGFGRFRTRDLGWVALVLALLIHLALFPIPVRWGFAPQKPIEVMPIDQAEVERLRSSLKKEPENIFVPSRELPAAKKAPKDARYGADRNIRVEKEQRARHGGVLPQRQPVWAAPRPKPGVTSKHTPSAAPGDFPIESPEARTQADRVGEKSDQAVLDDLPEGTETLLNARESVYYSFYLRIREAVGLPWQILAREAAESLELETGSYQTLAEVILDPSGNLLEVKVLKSSGYRALDQAVERAWIKAKTFRNPPRGLLEEDGKIRLKWTFNIELGEGGVLFLPPRRLPRDRVFD